ncbi:MAG: bifunctional riboflavin kinase/FAD synthetase [Armatimonadota bacterium]|nr:bifunctional riboflavin kinase/FAD synthetase [Armatimonadota bacterium]MCX7777441.1 bifunctional riboflavin kinase/FAD synthetase [Armatimonadota bacterium]MDW8025110.1 bifunctional riboflavin kinase/FAD synthetase [Armatimonadota bacterium]
MEVYNVSLREIENRGLPRQSRVMCIGTFDGVHIGHQRLINEAKVIAEESGMSLCVLTFRNHPLKVLSPNEAPKLLTTVKEKLLMLSQLGVNECLLVEFDSALAGMRAVEFCELLSEALSVRVLVMGESSSIGCGRDGTAERLHRMSGEGKLKVEIVVVEPARLGRSIVSSSWIRSELIRGHVRLAQMMLNRPYSLTGTVVAGRALGRRIGFPTINLQLDEEKLLPRFGVYAGIAEAEDFATQYHMVANIGMRPTVGGECASVEAHIVNEQVEVGYGREVTLYLLYFLRPERQFQSLKELANQIGHDVERARKLLHSRLANSFRGAHRCISSV